MKYKDAKSILKGYLTTVKNPKAPFPSALLKLLGAKGPNLFHQLETTFKFIHTFQKYQEDRTCIDIVLGKVTKQQMGVAFWNQWAKRWCKKYPRVEACCNRSRVNGALCDVHRMLQAAYEVGLLDPKEEIPETVLIDFCRQFPTKGLG